MTLKPNIANNGLLFGASTPPYSAVASHGKLHHTNGHNLEFATSLIGIFPMALSHCKRKNFYSLRQDAPASREVNCSKNMRALQRTRALEVSLFKTVPLQLQSTFTDMLQFNRSVKVERLYEERSFTLSIVVRVRCIVSMKSSLV